MERPQARRATPCLARCQCLGGRARFSRRGASAENQASTTCGSNCVPAHGELFNGLVAIHSLAVRAVGRHRAEGVAGADDPGNEWNLLAREAVRVALHRPSARGTSGRDGQPPPAGRPRVSSGRRPSIVWVLMIARSSSVRAPGLSMISFGILILPTSWRIAVNSADGRSSGPSFSSSATARTSETTS